MLLSAFAPPGLYDVSVALLRELHAIYERHRHERIPVIAYDAGLILLGPDHRPAECFPPLLIIQLCKPSDVPPNVLRWFHDTPYALAIPEALWRAIPHRLIDRSDDGKEIVLKTSWNGPGISPPLLPEI
jgi:hypothetical protein